MLHKTGTADGIARAQTGRLTACNNNQVTPSPRRCTLTASSGIHWQCQCDRLCHLTKNSRSGTLCKHHRPCCWHELIMGTTRHAQDQQTPTTVHGHPPSDPAQRRLTRSHGIHLTPTPKHTVEDDGGGNVVS